MEDWTQKLSDSTEVEVSVWNDELDSLTFKMIGGAEFNIIDKELKVLYQLLDSFYGEAKE